MLPPPPEEPDVERKRLTIAARSLLTWLALATVSVIVVPALAADPEVEKEAQALQKKAIEEDSLNVAYPAAIKKLQTAISKCGADKCSSSLKAALHRDLGAMQILSGSVDDGKASFAQAIGFDSSIDLDPAYKNPMLDGIWQDVKKHGAGGGGGGGGVGEGGGGGGSTAGPQPKGDFAHTPPPEALVKTPLPIYAEYPGSEDLARVVAKYKGSGMSEWKTLELKKLDTGFGALVPCKDVSQGTMRYYIQGFNENNDPVATSGSRNKPFSVPVKSQIAGDPPALPDQEPPKQCANADNECPPDFPGCGGPGKEGGEECDKGSECKSGQCTEGKCVSKKAGGESCENDSECTRGTCEAGKCTGKKADGEDCESDDECDSGKCKADKCVPSSANKMSRFWLGLSVQADIDFLPGSSNVCMLNAQGTGPVTGNSGYGCVDGSGNNFPGTSRTNNMLIQPGRSDQVQGGGKLGNVRILASIDYALNKNMLLGLHAGYVALTDPAATAPGAAFAPVHLEARFSYVFGNAPLTKKGLAPMLFLGIG